jgi:alkylation response protein AidB-like acyl-CoA dehydrogenase
MTRNLQAKLLGRVAALLPDMAARASELDKMAAFPEEDVSALREVGLFTAPLPEAYGGAAFGVGAEGADALLKLLALLGEGNLPLTRLFEAHVNALHLVLRYGSPELIATVAQDAAQGHLFGLWVTDPLDGEGVRLEGYRSLYGQKIFCSGAGAASRALITAVTPTGAQMLIVDVGAAAHVSPGNMRLSGMRASVTGMVDFSGMRVEITQLLGAEGDYLREPVFSAGAWRNAAGALGGVIALAKLHRAELRQRARDTDPHQRARFGQLVMEVETARLWLQEAARCACLEEGPAEEIVAIVNLARLAVEASSLKAMQLTQRSLGIAAFKAGHPAERICRDLAVFLRQPAPDETLDRAAGFFLHHGLKS